MPHKDFIVVGNDLTTYALAYNLLSSFPENNVVVTEQSETEKHLEYYSMLPAILLPQFNLSEPRLISKLTKGVTQELQELESLSRILELRKDPVAYLFRGEATERKFKRFVSILRQSGIKHAVLSNKEISESYPFTNNVQTRIIELYDTLKVDLNNVLEAYQKLFKELGGVQEIGNNIDKDLVTEKGRLLLHKAEGIFVCNKLDAFLKFNEIVAISLPKIQNVPYTTLIDVMTGINIVMDLEGYLHIWRHKNKEQMGSVIEQLKTTASLMTGIEIDDLSFAPKTLEVPVHPHKFVTKRAEKYFALSFPYFMEISLAPTFTKILSNNLEKIKKMESIDLETILALEIEI